MVHYDKIHDKYHFLTLCNHTFACLTHSNEWRPTYACGQVMPRSSIVLNFSMARDAFAQRQSKYQKSPRSEEFQNYHWELYMQQ